MGTIADRIRRAGRQSAVPSDEGTGVGQIGEREQAIIDRHTSKAPPVSFLQKAARGAAKREIEARQQQRAYAEQAAQTSPEMVSAVRGLLSNLGDRGKVLETLGKMNPAHRQEILKLAPGIAQQLGDDRGGAVSRTLGAVSRGISHGVSQPAMELAGQVFKSDLVQNPLVSPVGSVFGKALSDLGGSPEDIEFIRQLDAAASQEFSPARPGDPWYERGPLQAVEMVPWMSTVVGGGGLGRAAGTGVAGGIAGRAAAGGRVAQGVQKAGQAVGNLPPAVTAKLGMRAAPAITAGKVGELAGITAASFPPQYAQEVDQLKAMGMEDDSKLRLLAGGTAAVSGLIEGIVPNPFATGKVPLTDGAVRAARAYLWEAAKRAPGELSEEYLQGVTSGLGQHVAQYLDENAEDKSVADAFKNGWKQMKEAALPMAFLLGVPAVGGAGRVANQARLAQLQEKRAKGPISRNTARELGITGTSQEERTRKADQEIEELKKQPWWDFGTGEPEGAIPAPPGLAFLDRLRGKAAEVNEGKTKPSVVSTVGETPIDTIQTVIEQPGAPNASQVPTDETSPQVQGDGGQGSQVDSGSQVRQPGQEQDGEEQTGEESTAPEVLAEPTTGQPFSTKAYRGVKSGKDANEGSSGFWSPDKKVADAYAGKDGNVTEEVVEFQNPFVADNWGAAKKELGLPTSTSMPELQEHIATKGHDGIVFKSHNGKPEYVKLGKPAQPDVSTMVDKTPATDSPTVSPGTQETETRGTTKGFADLPSVSRSIFEIAMQNDTPESLLEILHSGNKNMRSEFEARTGTKLPKTVKGTRESVTQWFKEGKKQVGNEPSTEQPESKWQSETRAKLESIPALKGAKVEIDEKAGAAKVTRQDGLSTTIYFNADEELAKAAKAKGRKPEAIHGRYVRNPGEKTGSIYLRSDANHTNILNHEVMHWLEDQGVVTKEEVEQYGGREAIADKYGKWAETKQRKKDSVFQRIYDALEPVFSSQARFFEEVGQRKASPSGWKPAPKADVSIIESPDSKLETSRREKKNPQFPIAAGSPVTVYRRGKDGKEEMQDGVVEDFADHMPGNIKVRLSDGSLVTPFLVDVGPQRKSASTKDDTDELDLAGEGELTAAEVETQSRPDSGGLSIDEFADIFANPEVAPAKKPKAEKKQPALSDDDVADRLFDIQDGDSLDLPLWRAGEVNDAQGAFYSPRSERALRYGRKAERVRVRLKAVLAAETKEDAAKILGVQAEFYDAEDNTPADQDPDALTDIVLKEAAQKHGYDGIVFRMDGMGSPEVYAFPAVSSVPQAGASQPATAQSDFDDAAIKALDAILQAEKPKAAAADPATKLPTKAKSGQFVLPGMPGMAAEIDRQDFVRKYRDEALGKLWSWSNDPADDGDIQDAIDTMAPLMANVLNEVYAGKFKEIEDVWESDVYRTAAAASLNTELGDALVQDSMDAGIEQAFKNRPRKSTGKKPRKSEQTLSEAKSDMQAAHDAAAKLMGKIRSKLTSGVDPELMAETVQVAYLYAKAGIKTFKGYVEAIVENFGESFAQEFAPYMESGWRALNTRGIVNDAAGSVTDYLTEVSDENDRGPAGTGENSPGTRAEDMAEGEAETGQVDDIGGTAKGNDGSGRGLAGDGGSTEVAGDGTSGSTERSDEDVRLPSGPGGNYRIGQDERVGSGPGRGFSAKTRFTENVRAIRLLKTLEKEGRKATAEEQAILVKYVGWGGLKQSFGRGRLVGGKTVYEPIKGYETEFAELRELLTDEEWTSAKKSITNAHYTDPGVIRGMWQGLEALGFKGGKIVEPSSGTGLFFGLIPQAILDNPVTRLAATEIDSVSGRIAQQLYQDADIRVHGFEELNLPDNSVDLFISNVPFGQNQLSDKKDRSIKSDAIHNFFFNKAIKKTRPGGLVAFITSRYSMDEKDASTREFWDKNGANLVGVVRLPGGAFKGIANTDVVTDIIILQKREDGAEPSHAAPWKKRKNVAQKGYLELVPRPDGQPGKIKVRNEGDTAFPVNEYFGEHPEHIVGELAWTGTMQKTTENQINVEPPQKGSIGDRVSEIIGELPVDKAGLDRTAVMTEEMDSADMEAIKTGDWQDDHLRVEGDRIYRNDSGTRVEIPTPYGRHIKDKEGNITEIVPSKKGAQRFSALIRVFNAAERLIALQPTDASDEQIEAARLELNKVYDETVKEYGPLSAGWNKTFAEQSLTVASRLYSLEEYDPTTDTATKAAIFRERTQRPHSFPTKADNAKDALTISLSQQGRLDPEHVAGLLSKPIDTTMEELGDLVFKNNAGDWELAQSYLSGNVRQKLAEAKALAEKDESYARNVAALEAVQPKDLTPSQIEVRLNSPWIPTDVYEQFIAHLLRRTVKVSRSAAAGKWFITPESRTRSDQLELLDWGIDRMPALDIITRHLNRGDMRVYDPDGNGGRVVNQDDSTQVLAKLTKIKAEFERWLWSDADRSDRLTELYNREINNMHQEPRDGSHLTFPGMSDDVRKKLDKHQVNAVWRYLTSGNMLLAHVVGAGKSWIMTAAAMEQKRISGNPSFKTMIAVPNHLVTSGQFVKEILEAYPSAKVLAATPDSLSGIGRRSFLKKIATGNYDIVVIAHSSFGKIPLNPENEAEFIQKQIDELEVEVRTARADSDRSYEAELQTMIANLSDKLSKISSDLKRDELSTYFDDLNIDSLFVDEAHEFKNLAFRTKMSRVPGVNPTGSNMAFDMWMKTTYFNKATGEKKLLFATGTPIANAIAEMYTMQRYLQPSVLERLGLQQFDSWAASFADEVTKPEIDPAGGGMRMHSRLSQYINMPELSAIFRQIADVQTADMLVDVLKRPLIEGDAPQAIKAERNAILEEIIEGLQERAQRVRSGVVDKSEDNMLKIVGDGRKAATDIRLIDPTYPDLKGSKVNIAVENIHRIWEETQEQKSTQIVWLDVTSPSTDYPFNLYHEIVDKLAALGIPRNEIAIMHDYNEKTKAQLFRSMNKGDIRILLGSTPVMGTGVNVQKRLIASHHLDVPWRPDQLEQRDGRILRRGNTNKKVKIIRYISKGSFDAFMWDKIEQKSSFIRAAMSGASDRVLDASEAEDMSAAEMKAAAADDPNLIRYVTVQAEVNRLESEYRGFLDQQSQIRRGIATAKSNVERYTNRADAFEAMIKEREILDIPEGEVRAKIGDKEFTNPKEFGEALTTALINSPSTRNQKGAVVRFTYNGFDGEISQDMRYASDEVKASGWLGSQLTNVDLYLGESPSGNVTRLNNAIGKIKDGLELWRTEAERNSLKVPALEKRINAEWPETKKLSDLRQEQSTLASLVQSGKGDEHKKAVAGKLNELTGRAIIISADTGRYLFKDVSIPKGDSKNAAQNEAPAVVPANLVDEAEGRLTAERNRQREERLRALRDQAEVYEWDRTVNPRPAKKKSSPKRRGSSGDGDGDGIAKMADPTRQSRSGRGVAGTDTGIAAADIQRTAERVFGIAIRQGGFNQRAAGIYKWLTGRNKPPSPNVARTAEDHYANLAVLAHEIAHGIDEKTKAVRSMPPKVRSEMRSLDYDPTKARAFEGWAEFMRRYMTEPPIDVVGRSVPNPGLDAPKTLEWFEGTFLQANPKTAKAIAEFRRYAQQFAQQSVFQRAGTLIAERQPQDLKFSERWLHQSRRRIHRMKTAFIDKFHTLEWIQKEAKERGHEGIGIYDLTMAHYMSVSSHATIAFEEGVRSLQTGAPMGNTSLWSLRDHLESDRDYSEAVLYSLARHTLFMDDTKRGYNTGMDVKDAEALIAEVKASGKQKRYEAFAKALAQFNDDLIEMLVEAGALPRKDADAMLRAYDGGNYFPLHRVQDAERGMFAGSGVGFVNLGSAVKKRSRKGSGRQIVDPIDATIARAMRFYGRAIQARQQQVLAETLDPLMGGVGGMGGLMDRVDPRRKVTQGTVDEILKTLVEEGIVEADDARAMRIASKILDSEVDGPGAESIKWFAERHGIEEIDGEYDWANLEHAAESEPNALAIISLWRPDYTPSARKRTVIIYDKHGKPIMYEMDPDLYATATGMDEPQFNWFMSIFREAARYFKTGAVGANTGFGTANLLRDYWEFQGKARHTKGLSSLGKPPEMLGRYVAEKALRAMPILQKVTGVKPNNPLIRLYEESGGKVYSVVGHDVQSRRRYRRRRIGKSTMSKLGLSLGRPHDSAESILQGIQDFIAISDAPPRLADAEAALKEDGFVVREDKWFDLNANQFVDHLPEATRIKASIAMAEATINFKRIGLYGQYVESFFPFFNATVQAMYRQYNQTKTLKSLGRKDTEGVQAKRYLVYLAALASTGVLYWMLRHDDDDWREQDSYLRDGYWTWGKDGKTYYRIPKPRDSAVVSNVVENMLDAWYHEDARDISDVLKRDFGGRIPTGGGFLRGLGETYVANYDYFRERDLTPQALKDLPKEQQVESTTTRASQALGQVTGRYLNTSPIQLEHLLDSSTGGFYRRMADMYDASVDGRIGPEHYPFLRGLMLDRHQARSIATFYEEKDALDEQIKRDVVDNGKASDEAIGKLAVLEEYAAIMKSMRKAEGKKLGRRRNYEFQPYIAGLARRALGYKELQNNPDPFKAKDVPEEIASILKDYGGRAVVMATEQLKNQGEYDSESDYEDQRKTIVRGKAKLESLGLSYDEARDELFAYWKTRWGSTHEIRSGRPVLKDAVKKRLNALRQLYPEQSE